MLPILRFAKLLHARPEPSPASASIRCFAGAGDVSAWLALCDTAFAGLTASGRRRTADDFEREFTAKPWWSPERMWFAEDEVGNVVGSATLGRSGLPPDDVPCVLWLMVDPRYRRRGIGRALLTTLEQAAWDSGERRLTLETHAAWRDAVRLYERCGYERTT